MTGFSNKLALLFCLSAFGPIGSDAGNMLNNRWQVNQSSFYTKFWSFGQNQYNTIFETVEASPTVEYERFEPGDDFSAMTLYRNVEDHSLRGSSSAFLDAEDLKYFTFNFETTLKREVTLVKNEHVRPCKIFEETEKNEFYVLVSGCLVPMTSILEGLNSPAGSKPPSSDSLEYLQVGTTGFYMENGQSWLNGVYNGIPAVESDWCAPLGNTKSGKLTFAAGKGTYYEITQHLRSDSTTYKVETYTAAGRFELYDGPSYKGTYSFYKVSPHIGLYATLSTEGKFTNTLSIIAMSDAYLSDSGAVYDIPVSVDSDDSDDSAGQLKATLCTRIGNSNTWRVSEEKFYVIINTACHSSVTTYKKHDGLYKILSGFTIDHSRFSICTETGKVTRVMTNNA